MLKSVFGHQYFQLIEPRDMHCQFSVRLPREYMKRTAQPPCSATRIDLLFSPVALKVDLFEFSFNC